MNLETQITLDKFKPRSYQLPLCKTFEEGKLKRMLVLWPRRAGKDICAFNLMVRAAIRMIGVYYYIFPTYSQARKVIWDSITNTGDRFLDYIPKELVAGTNSQEMKIKLINGSIIQLVGSDNIDAIVGTNPRGIIFSEYALQDPRAYQFLRPIILANNGWALFISTVRGKNHLFEMFEIARNNPETWFSQKLTVEDTGHISLHDIEAEKAEGLMSEDLIQQEYYNSFELGVEGSYYAKYLDKMRVKGQIGVVPWENGFKVNTVWDLGVRDSTTIIWYQVIGQTIRIIDCYENSKVGLDHYVKVIQQKPYIYNKHIAPHDIKVREFTSGMARIDAARNLGIIFTTAPDLSIMDGIESVRSSFNRIWIDEVKCRTLIKSLENYRQEYDSKRKVYKPYPLHDWSSHFADCMRYLCISLPKVKDGLSAEELDARYKKAMYGENNNLPSVFRDDLPNY